MLLAPSPSESGVDARAFRGFRFPAEIILWAVHWHLQFPISLRDLERMLADRGIAVDHVTLQRWIKRFAPSWRSACAAICGLVVTCVLKVTVVTY